jgi:membrane protein implicated in regulation of membrane protease activity
MTHTPPENARLVRRVFGIPILIGVAILFGLLSALLGEGVAWHVGAWLALSAPIVLLVWCYVRSAPEIRSNSSTTEPKHRA